MAIASLALFPFAVTELLLDYSLMRELGSILHMQQIDIERFVFIIVLVASISGLILGIRSIHSRKRRIMGIVGTALNAIAVGTAPLFFVVGPLNT